MADMVPWLASATTALATVVAVWLTGRAARRTKQVETESAHALATTPSYAEIDARVRYQDTRIDDLLKRIEALESERDELRHERDELMRKVIAGQGREQAYRDHIIGLWAWIDDRAAGAPIALKRPAWVDEDTLTNMPKVDLGQA